MSDPIVRPWKAPNRPIVIGRWRCQRASLRAASALSVPLLVKKTLDGPSIGARSESLWASSTWRS